MCFDHQSVTFVDDPLWVPLKILELQAANWADTSGLLPSQGSRAVASLTVQPSSHPGASPQGDPAPAPGRLRMAQTPVDPTPSAQDRESEEASAAEPEAAPEPALNQEAGGSRQVPCSAQGLGPRVQPGPLPIEEPDQQPGQEADQQPGQEADQQPGQEADQGQEEEAEAPPTPGTEVLEEPGAAEGPQAGGELSSDLGGLGHLPGREEHVARQQASASPSCQDTEPVADLGSAGSGSGRSPSPPVPLPGSLPLPAELPPPLPTTLQYPAGGPRPQSGAAGPPCGASIPTNPSEPDTAADSAAPNPPAPNSPAPNPPAPNSPAPNPPAPNPPAPNPPGGGMVPGAAAPTVAAPGLGSAPKRDQTARLGTVVPGAGFRSISIQPPAGKSKAGPPAPSAAARVQPLLAPHPPKAFVATSAKLVPVALARPGTVEVGSGAVGAKRPSTGIAAGEGRGPALKDGITLEVEPACVADGRGGACTGLGASAAASGKAAALAAIQAAREAAEARARAAATSDPRHAPPIEQLGNAKVQPGKAVRASHAEPIPTQPAAYIHPNPYPSAAQPLPHSSVQHGHPSQLAEESDEATVTVTADDNEAASLEQGWHESRWHHVQGGGHVPAPPPPPPHTTSLQSSAVQHNARKSATARGRKGAKARGRHLVLDTSSDEANSDTEHRGDMEDDGSEGAGEYFVDCIVDEVSLNGHRFVQRNTNEVRVPLTTAAGHRAVVELLASSRREQSYLNAGRWLTAEVWTFGA
ncbi:hypothetical protein QJQ45_008271 [Haematococcus lacustris]|nr:hypothetical protein QJQ45_008271 [Haematococcus lacustris]